jgi:purine nucleoside permease
MEDTGVLQAMTYLDRVGRADKDRVLVLRAGSNYTMPPPGVDAAAYLLRENEGYAGLEAAVESLYVVGSKVVDELLGHWDRYEQAEPR